MNHVILLSCIDLLGWRPVWHGVMSFNNMFAFRSYFGSSIIVNSLDLLLWTFWNLDIFWEPLEARGNSKQSLVSVTIALRE
jgi:hypothetical protein